MAILLTFDGVVEALKVAWAEGGVAVQNQEAIDTTDCLYWYENIEDKRVCCPIGTAMPMEFLQFLADKDMLSTNVTHLFARHVVQVKSGDLAGIQALQRIHDASMDASFTTEQAIAAFKTRLANLFPDLVLEDGVP